MSVVRDEVRSDIHAWLKARLDQTISDDADIAQLGANSLFAMEFLVELENRFEIEIPTDALDQIDAITVNSMTDVVCRLHSEIAHTAGTRSGEL
jgi:acyl carrier protein